MTNIKDHVFLTKITYREIKRPKRKKRIEKREDKLKLLWWDPQGT